MKKSEIYKLWVFGSIPSSEVFLSTTVAVLRLQSLLEVWSLDPTC